MRPGLLEAAVTVSVWDSLARSEERRVGETVCSPGFSLRVRLEIGLRVGAWLTEFTVTVKVRVTVLLAEAPSLTVTVTVALPFPLTTGVKESVPVVLGLVYVTVGLGMRPGLLEVAVTASVWDSLA